MTRLPALALLLPLAACTPEGTSPVDDTAAPVPEPAPLATLSSGECPDLAASGTSSFLSSGVERTASIVIPATQGADMPVVFFFHGLLSPDQTPEPTTYHVQALDMQDLADETGAVIVLPESRLMEYYGYSFFMWQVMDEDEEDLVLYDDLRTCVGETLDVDLHRVAAVGFSGGALFTTVLVRERADTLASMVELSGGADVDFPTYEDPIARYETPAWPLPALLASGGEEDTWPQGLTLVDFSAATDTLQAHLVADGHPTVRCRHEQGHTVTWGEWDAAVEWALAHRWNDPVPYPSDALPDFGSWCETAR